MTGEADRELSAEAQARAREGVEHLQAAARELIRAARAALDVAEEWVDDPQSLASLAGTLAVLGDVARRAAGMSAGARPEPRAGGDGGSGAEPGEPRVERIDVR